MMIRTEYISESSRVCRSAISGVPVCNLKRSMDCVAGAT